MNKTSHPKYTHFTKNSSIQIAGPSAIETLPTSDYCQSNSKRYNPSEAGKIEKSIITSVY